MDENDTQIEEDFEQFFVRKQGLLASKKVHKNTLLSKIAIQHIFKQKLTVGYFCCLLRTRKYKYCPKFWTCPK